VVEVFCGGKAVRGLQEAKVATKKKLIPLKTEGRKMLGFRLLSGSGGLSLSNKGILGGNL